MQITIKPGLIAQLVDQMVDYTLFDNYDKDVVKTAGLPKKAVIVKEILADEKFLKSAEKYLSEYLNNGDVINDAFHEANCPVLGRYEIACEKAYGKLDEDRAIKREAEDLKRSIKVLEAAGFTVTKK